MLSGLHILSCLFTRWDTNIGLQVGKPFEGHTDAVYCAFSPDGKRTVSGSADSIIRLWDTETGSQVGNLTGHRKVIHVLPRWKIGRICLWIAQDPAHGGKSSLMQIWCHSQHHHHHVVSRGFTNWIIWSVRTLVACFVSMHASFRFPFHHIYPTWAPTHHLILSLFPLPTTACYSHYLQPNVPVHVLCVCSSETHQAQ